VMNNSKKLEQFLMGRIERKMNESNLESEVEGRMKEIFNKLEARIEYLRQLQTDNRLM